MQTSATVTVSTRVYLNENGDIDPYVIVCTYMTTMAWRHT